MGSCISSKHYKVKLDNTTDQMDGELEEVQIELNMCQKRLLDLSSQSAVLSYKVASTRHENDQLKSYIVQMKIKSTDNTLQLKRRLAKEKETAEYYQVKFKTLQNKLCEKRRINVALLQKYTLLERIHSDSRPVSMALTTSGISSGNSFV